MTLIRIEAPHFVAGVVLEGDVVVRAAPIVKYMRGWNVMRIFRYAKKKGWNCEHVVGCEHRTKPEISTMSNWEFLARFGPIIDLAFQIWRKHHVQHT